MLSNGGESLNKESKEYIKKVLGPLCDELDISISLYDEKEDDFKDLQKEILEKFKKKRTKDYMDGFSKGKETGWIEGYKAAFEKMFSGSER